MDRLGHFNRELPRDWLNHLLDLYDKEHRIGDSPRLLGHECKDKRIVGLVFRLCKNHFSVLPAEAKFQATQLFEALLNAGKVEAVLDQAVACIQVSSKLSCVRTVIYPRMISQQFPCICKKQAMRNEMLACQMLLDQLGKPHLMTCVEVILASLNLCQVDGFLECVDKVAQVVALNKFSLLCQLFQRTSGLEPKSKEDFLQVKVMMAEHIFLASSIVLTTAYVLNVDVDPIQMQLESMTRLEASKLKYFSKLTLKGISDVSQRL